MHVLLVNNLYPPIMAGGAELIVAWLGEGLAAQGHRVTAVSTCGPDMEPYPTERRNGVEVLRFFPRNMYWSFTRQGQPPLKRALWHLRDAWNLDAARRFRTILAEHQPDIVHTHVIDGFSASLWRRARQVGVPVVHTAHDYHLICPRAFLLTRDWKLCTRPAMACRVYRRWHLATANAVDLFVSPSQFLLDKHLEAGLAARRTALVRNGIPLPQPGERVTRSSGTVRLLLLCRLTVEKGVQVVLDAMRRLPPSLDIELTIAGRGPLEQTASQAAAEDPRIRFLGFVEGEQKHQLLTAADYLLIPSLWYENAPVAVVEAAVYGLGLIGSRIGGIPELVQEGTTGFLFKPGDTGELANVIEEVATGRRILRSFSAASRKVAERHALPRMVDAYEHQYKELLRTSQDAAGNMSRSTAVGMVH